MSALLITMTSGKSADFSMHPFQYLFKVQPSVTSACQHPHSRMLNDFYFNALESGIFLRLRCEFLRAGCLTPLKLEPLPRMSRNSLRDAWGLLGEG